MSGSQPGLGAAHASSRSAILDLIRAAGTISRVELTRATGLTAATISTVVRRLIDDGLVLEVGRAESTGGKPAHAPAARPVRALRGRRPPRPRRHHLRHRQPRRRDRRPLAAAGSRVRRPRHRRRPHRRGGPHDHHTGRRRPRAHPRAGRRLAGTDLRVDGDDAHPARHAALGRVPARRRPRGRRRAVGPARQRRDRRRHRRVLVRRDRHRRRRSRRSTWAPASAPGSSSTAPSTAGPARTPARSGTSASTSTVPVCWCGNVGCVEVLAGPAAVVAAARDARCSTCPAATSRRTSGRSPAPPAGVRTCRCSCSSGPRGTSASRRRPWPTCSTSSSSSSPGRRSRSRVAVPAGDRAPARPVVLRPGQPPRAGHHLLERP